MNVMEFGSRQLRFSVSLMGILPSTKYRHIIVRCRKNLCASLQFLELLAWIRVCSLYSVARLPVRPHMGHLRHGHNVSSFAWRIGARKVDFVSKLRSLLFQHPVPYFGIDCHCCFQPSCVLEALNIALERTLATAGLDAKHIHRGPASRCGS
jgi:hypothetical protein